MLIAISKHNLIGKCLLDILRGKDVSDGVQSILGVSAISPMWEPLVILTFNTRGLIDDSDGVQSILGVSAISPMWEPLVILTFNTRGLTDDICKVVPLHYQF